MDLTKQVKEKFHLEEEETPGENGKAPEVTKKVITQEMIDQVTKEFAEQLDNLSESLIEGGYDPADIIPAIEVFYKMTGDFVEKLKNQKATGKTVIPAAKQEKAAEEPEEQKSDLDEFYDFEKFDAFTGKFLGPGKIVTVQNRPLKTWKVQELDGTDWLIPQWKIFSQVQGNFLGFENETAGKYIYQLTYKGDFLVEILKKLPPTNGK